MPKLIYKDPTVDRVKKLAPLIGDFGVCAVLAEMERMF